MIEHISYCKGTWVLELLLELIDHTSEIVLTGMDKVQERGAPLPGNDKEN